MNKSGTVWHTQRLVNARQQEALRGHYGCKSAEFKHLGDEEAVTQNFRNFE